jgi:AmmeMemoRadiSam system protein A
MTALAPQSATRLLALARDSIRGALAGAPLPVPTRCDPDLEERRGAFVTLKSRGGRLRGCIGRVESPWPLWETVARMARAAALEDPRFPPLVARELDGVHIELSVLTPPRALADAGEVVPGVHGVMVARGTARGLFLPQVAGEQAWSRDRLLDEVCIKAGLAPDSWRRSGTTLYVFSAEVFAEPDVAED